MTMNPLPPQAYTKETLVKAYAWLQSQSESIKELATTPDVLVSLYLKAKLQGSEALERPSIQNFKNELKNLAGMIGDFEVIEPDSSAPTVRFRSQDAKPEFRQESRTTPPKATQPAPSAQTQTPEYFQTPRSEIRFDSTPESFHTDARPSSSSYDLRTENMIQEVKNQFNLSHEDEAIRLLIATGYHQLKTLLKR